MNTGWQTRRRRARRGVLVTGSGFHEFSAIPSVWSRIRRPLCAFCRRGEKDQLTGLWEFGRVWVCTECARDIVDGKMPVGWRE